jgi:adenosine deaminase
MPGGKSRRVPTVELHRHFEAGIRPEVIAQLAIRHNVSSVSTRSGQLLHGVDAREPDSIRRYYRTVAAGFSAADGFARFVDSFGLPLAVLRTLEDLEAAVCDQLLDCAAAGSVHTELRGSPFTYRERIDASLDEIARALVSGVDRAWREHRVSGTFILAFSRQKGLAPSDAPPVQRQAHVVACLAAALHRPDRPVGLDIAGFPEIAFPPRLFEDALRPAREAGVPLTVHGGEQATPPAFEAAPPALIVEAIERLGARRIGHGTSLAGSASARALARQCRIGVECCPWSNDRMGFMPVAGHPLPLLLREGLLVSLATDDPLMFGPFTVAETFEAVAQPLGLDEEELRQLTRNGIDTAFVTEERREWLRRRL